MTAPEFVPLADIVRPRAPIAVAVAVEQHIAREAPDGAAAAEPERVAHGDLHDAAREARVFRARLADAFDDALARLLRDVAAGVLARELQLAPCDLLALVRRALERAPAVRLRLAPPDAARASASAYGLPVVADETLDEGDAVLELADGAVDARLGVRLAAVLENVA